MYDRVIQIAPQDYSKNNLYLVAFITNNIIIYKN